MNTLNFVHRRALHAALLCMAGALALILFYWYGVSKGALPSPAKPLVSKPDVVATNPQPAKAVTVVAAPPPSQPPPAPASKAAARAEPHQIGSSPIFGRPTGADAASVTEAPNPATRPPPKSATTNLATTPAIPARPVPSNASTNVTAEDERLARHWLDNTNQRPAIRVRYQPADIVRLATELNRGLFVAGSGTTNRREFYLQSKSSKAPLFSPFTKEAARQFSSYSLALNPSATFEPLLTPLPAYFPGGDFDLSFVPDTELATTILGQVACASRSLPAEAIGANQPIFEGQLRLDGAQAVFQLTEARFGTNRLFFAGRHTPEAH
jgi:hypothetical protein